MWNIGRTLLCYLSGPLNRSPYTFIHLKVFVEEWVVDEQFR